LLAHLDLLVKGDKALTGTERSNASTAVARLAELVDVQTGQVRTSVELPPRTFPAALSGLNERRSTR
jgi:hypothetical protein